MGNRHGRGIGPRTKRGGWSPECGDATSLLMAGVAQSTAPPGSTLLSVALLAQT